MLELRNVNKSYTMGDSVVYALRNVSVKVESGDFVAIMGPSGSGKSTLMHIMGLLDVPESGSYLVNGREVSQLDEDELAVLRRKVLGFIFQQFNLLPRMTAAQNVALPLFYSEGKLAAEKAHEVLEAVGLGTRMEHRPNELSGGQQQRVALARALVNRPSLLLLDEPLGALDLKLRREMQIELKAIQIEVGLTFLHVTHDQEEAMDMADTVAVMNKGRIEQMGAPEKLYDRPKTVFVSKFLGQSNLFVGEVAESNAESVSINVSGNKITVPKARAENHTGTIAIGVRPEKAFFHEEEPQRTSDSNLIGPGEIIDIRFTGVSNQYLIEIPAIGNVTVFAQNVGKSPVVELGAKVWVSWKVEHSFGLADLPANSQTESISVI